MAGESHFSLVEACRAGDLPSARRLIFQGADLHADDNAPLFQAAVNRHLELVEYLLEVGADPKDGGEYIILTVCHLGSLPALKILIESVNRDVRCDESLLSIALDNGNLEIVKYLRSFLEAETYIFASPPTRFGHQTVIQELKMNFYPNHIASCSYFGHLDLLKYCLRRQPPSEQYLRMVVSSAYEGAAHRIAELGLLVDFDRRLRDSTFSPGQMHPSLRPQWEIISWLQGEFRENSKNCPWKDQALTWACYYGQDNAIAYLLETYGHNPFGKETLNASLQAACVMGHLAAAKKIWRLLRCQKEKKRKFLASALERSCQNGHLSLVEYLISLLKRLGLPLDQTKCLQRASEGGRLEVIKYLLSAESPAEKRSVFLRPKSLDVEVFKLLSSGGYLRDNQEDFLTLAAHHSLPLLEYLLGKTTFSAEASQEALMFACQGEQVECVNFLLRRFVFPEEVRNEALKKAAGDGSPKIVKFLLTESGAALSSQSKNLALHSAVNSGSLEKVRYLLEAGAEVSFETLGASVSTDNFLLRYLCKVSPGAFRSAEQKTSLLRLALVKGAKFSVKFLLERGAPFSCIEGDLLTQYYRRSKGGVKIFNQEYIKNRIDLDSVSAEDFREAVDDKFISELGPDFRLLAELDARHNLGLLLRRDLNLVRARKIYRTLLAKYYQPDGPGYFLARNSFARGLSAR